MWFDPVSMTRCLEDGEEIVAADPLCEFFLGGVRPGRLGSRDDSVR